MSKPDDMNDALRTQLAELIAEIERLRGIFKSVHHGLEDKMGCCKSCGWVLQFGGGHDPDCPFRPVDEYYADTSSETGRD